MKSTINKFGRISTRGPVEGHCNICDDFGPLTEDHIVPKGIAKLRQVDMLHLTEMLRIERPHSSRRYMQSGMSFRSLCRRCNTDLLGGKYDPALIHLSNSVAQHLRSGLVLPDTMKVSARPGLVARSVLGHLMAIGVERRQKGEAGDTVAKYFLDDTQSLPDGMDIFLWVYPYRRQIAVRDAVLVHGFFKVHTVMWCLKFLPLGFLITWDKSAKLEFRLPRLNDFMIGAGTAAVDIPLPLTQLPQQDFPEAPDDDGAVLYGDGAVGSLPRSNLIA